MDDHPLADPARTVVCECCELDNPERLSSAVRDSHGLFVGRWICRKCNEHRGDKLKTARDHEDELRMRWRETWDELDEALNRGEEYREKMLAAFRSRDNILKQFEKLSFHHRATDHGCVCGKRKCEVLAIIDTDWINDHIARMYKRNAV